MPERRADIHDADTEEFEAVAPTQEFEAISSERGESEIHPGKMLAFVIATIIVVIAMNIRWLGDAVAWIGAIILFVLLAAIFTWLMMKLVVWVTRR